MKSRLLFLGIIISIFGCSKPVPEARIDHFEAFVSKNVLPRNVDIWLPAGYDSTTAQRYAVLYMHDGQNLFDTTTSYGGKEWQVDEMMSRLLAGNKTDSCIVVGIWNTPKRFFEYAPQKPFNLLPDQVKIDARVEFQGDSTPLSDAYLRFIVEELKPFVDTRYKTKPDKNHTFIMGSSMGGLISMYAVAEYPDVFGGAACLSTHWPFSLKGNSTCFTKAVIQYLAPGLPRLRDSKFYFDFGTATLDAWYEPHQKMIDSLFAVNSFDNRHFVSLKFEGAEHNEKSWAARLDKPLVFLLGK